MERWPAHLCTRCQSSTHTRWLAELTGRLCVEAGGASVHRYSLKGCKSIGFRRQKLLIFQNIRSAAGSHPTPVFMLQPKHLSDTISHELPCRLVSSRDAQSWDHRSRGRRSRLASSLRGHRAFSRSEVSGGRIRCRLLLRQTRGVEMTAERHGCHSGVGGGMSKSSACSVFGCVLLF